MPEKFAILLDGTIGAGKTTTGRALARRFDGAFLDGDDFRAAGKPWYCSSLSTCHGLREAGLKALRERSTLFIARPVRCLDWVYFHHHFRRFGIAPLLIGLQARATNITHPDRGRTFSPPETARMAVMIGEGYGARPYSNFHIRTDRSDLDSTVSTIETRLRRLMAQMR